MEAECWFLALGSRVDDRGRLTLWSMEADCWFLVLGSREDDLG